MDQWLTDTFSAPDATTMLGIAAKSTVIYLVVVFAMRLVGTRQLGQMTTYDFVLIVVVANAVQNALVGGDSTLAGGLVSALTLLLLNRLFTAFLSAFPWLEQRMVGEPVVLVSDGQPRLESMKREGVTPEELLAALREHAVGSLEDVRLAVLEVDGEISVVPKDSTVHRTRHRIGRVRTS